MSRHIDEAWEVYDSYAVLAAGPRYIAVRLASAPHDQVCLVAEVPPGLEHLVENALEVAARIVALHNGAG